MRSSSDSAFFSPSSVRISGRSVSRKRYSWDSNSLTLGRRDVVQLAAGRRDQDRDLLLDRQRHVLRLLDDLGQLLAAVELVAGGLVQVAGELREGRQRAVLREVQLERRGDALHRLGLGRGAHPGDRDADVHGGPLAGVEQVGLEEDLAVGDRDHVGRDVRRDVVGLRLDDRQRGQRAAAVVVVEARGALEQAAVEVEHVAGVRLAAGRAAEQQRHLAVGPGVLARGRRRRSGRPCPAP